MSKSLIEVFSVWIFIWFILFYIHIIPFNPLFFLIISLHIIIICGLYILYFNHINYYNIIKYIIINIFMKLIPILLLIEFPLVFYLYDIYFGIFLFITYNILMKFMNKNLIQNYKELYLSNISDNHEHYKGVISTYYDYIYSKLF